MKSSFFLRVCVWGREWSPVFVFSVSLAVRCSLGVASTMRSDWPVETNGFRTVGWEAAGGRGLQAVFL